MRTKLVHATVAAVLGMAFVLPASAQVKPDVLVKQRDVAELRWLNLFIVKLETCGNSSF